MAELRRFVAGMTLAAILFAAVLMLFATVRARPQNLPWTPLDLGNPIGLFTQPKLTALGRDFPKCRALLDKAGVRYTVLAPLHEGRCGFDDGVRFDAGGARPAAYAPGAPALACPVAAALSVWEWEVVQPAAQKMLGTRVIRFDHLGSYNCRHIAGSASWSEHSGADAIDIAGVTLADGRTLTIARDWKGNGPDATFLHLIRNGACRLFATTLSPEYNAAHHDHLHLDQAARGAWGGRACR